MKDKYPTIMRLCNLFLVVLFKTMIFSAFVWHFSVWAEEKGSVFSTWEGFEVDKCASIWLIKRFIDEDAVIKFFPKGESISEGTPFDTPDAKLRRYHNMSTFEAILKHYDIKDQRLIYIGKIIHDIEINIWERKVFDETMMVQNETRNIITNSKNNDELIKRSVDFFDALYGKIPNSR